jgi:hypothetical protein
MKIHIRYFIVTLALGLFYIYLTDDKPIIVVYPNPENLDLFQYQKTSGSCFSYELHEVRCPTENT